MSNELHKNKLDEALKKALDSIEPAYDAGLWERVEKKLDQNTRPWYRKYLNVFTVLVLAGTICTASYLVFFDIKKREGKTGAEHVLHPSSKKEKATAFETENDVADRNETQDDSNNELTGNGHSNKTPDKSGILGGDGHAEALQAPPHGRSQLPVGHNGKKGSGVAEMNNNNAGSASGNKGKDETITAAGNKQGLTGNKLPGIKGKETLTKEKRNSKQRDAGDNDRSKKSTSHGQKRETAGNPGLLVNSRSPVKGNNARKNMDPEEKQGSEQAASDLQQKVDVPVPGQQAEAMAVPVTSSTGRNEDDAGAGRQKEIKANEREAGKSAVSDSTTLAGHGVQEKDSMNNEASRDVRALTGAPAAGDSLTTGQLLPDSSQTDSLQQENTAAEGKTGTETAAAADASADHFLINFWEHPGYTGAEKEHTVQVRYKRQWLNLDKGPENFLAAYDMALGSRKHIGVGTYVSSTIAGFTRRQTCALSYSHQFVFKTRDKIRLALAASYNRKTLNWNAFNFGDMFHILYGVVYPSQEPVVKTDISYLDLHSGLWYSRENSYLGLSVFHLNTPDESHSERRSAIPRDYYFTGGYKFILNRSWSLTPSLVVKKTEKLYTTYSPSLLVVYRGRFFAGAGSPNLNLFNIQAGAVLFRHVRIGINAGIPLNGKLKEFGNFGLIEGGIRYQFGSFDAM